MSKATIKLAYRQVIDNQTAGAFEQDVFTDTYHEFLLQVQAYNQENKYLTLAEVIAANPKANSLHYKVGFSIGLYVKALNGTIPWLTDNSGKANLAFESHEFEIVSSAINDASAHKVRLTYITGDIRLLAVIGDYLVLSASEQTFTIKMRDDLSIVHYSEM